MTSDYSFQPPNSPEAERAVLGSCLLSNEALGNAIEILRPDDFYSVENRKVFEIVSEMYLADRPADIVTVQIELNSRGMLEALGGQAFLANLVASVTTTSNVSYHAEIVRENSIRRKLFAVGDEIRAMSTNTSLSTREIIEHAEKLLFDAAQNKTSTDFKHVRDIIGPVFTDVEERLEQNAGTTTGYPTGFADLDSFTGGLQPGSLNIIAARPSMGKTAFAVNIAQFGGGDSNRPVLIFSLEMPAEQLVLRMLAAESGVNLSALSNGTFDTSAFDEVKRACHSH